jgi:predicted dehydrogenase
MQSFQLFARISMDSNAKTGIAVIGYGYWSPKLIRNINAHSGWELRAICEKALSRHERIAEENPGIDIHQHYRDVFARKDITAVVIATIPSSHFRIALQALEAGKHVLVEKPLSLRPYEADLLVATARRHRVTLMVDHTYLYSPAIQKAKEYIRSGALGNVLSFSTTRVNLGIFQRDTNVVWDLAPHDLSILMYLFAERPYAVSAIGSKTIAYPAQQRSQESIAQIMLFYKAFTAHIEVSWMSPIKVRQIFITGENATVLYDQLAADPLVTFSKGVFPKSDASDSGPLFEYVSEPPVPLPIPQGSEDLATMLQDFYGAVTTGSEPISHAALGADVARALRAIEKSVRADGRKIPIRYRAVPTVILRMIRRYIKLRRKY